MGHSVALFGEAEKGQFNTAYFCYSLPELLDSFGNPPESSLGLHFAIQSLLFNQNLIYFRVEEEGFSVKDYLLGLKFLKKYDQISNISAICLPGVGNSEILKEVTPICQAHNSLILTSESDLYDYLTSN
ncbi:MAG: hypothetical protein L7U87_02615 [Chlamydiales bacterium]|nr:hypothetical protein [Chlamydiales bacterium]